MKSYSDIKIAIIGRSPYTINYEMAFSYFHVKADTILSVGALENYDALVLPGGGDITPAFYGQENINSQNIDTELDILQIQALDLFTKHEKPILGICKGLQLINIYFGGDLIQDLKTTSLHQSHTKDLFHVTTTVPGSRIHRIYNDFPIVNSSHHQGLRNIGKSLNITQITSDGVIEGIEHSKLPILGFQWHPERLYPFFPKTALLSNSSNGSPIFKEFITLILERQF